MQNRPDVCVIIPAFNEEETLGECLDSLLQYFRREQIIVVDNGSSDLTQTIAFSYAVDTFEEPKRGKGHAIRAGIRHAMERGAQWIALHDADNEYSAQGIYDLVSFCQQSYGINDRPVMGVGERRVVLADILWRSLVANWVARSTLRLCLNKEPPKDILTGSRVMNRQFAKMIMEELTITGFEMEAKITKFAIKRDVVILSHPVDYAPRPAQKKKISAFDIMPIIRACLG